MEKKKRHLNVIAYSNLGARLQLILTCETDDIREIITEALTKISQYSNQLEQYKIIHIDSLNRPDDLKI